MTQSHTPTPYDINGFNLAQIIRIFDGPDSKGRHYKDGRHQVVIANVGSDEMPWEERHALTNFIKTACNSHDALVDALVKARYALIMSGQLSDWVEICDKALAQARGDK